MAVVTMRQLLDSGVHFGHQTSRWNPKMKRFIFTERNGIYIIDLQLSLQMIDNAYAFVRDTVAHGGTVLFVGTKRQAQEAVVEQASRVGMPYISERWLGGMLTNFQTVSKRVARLKELEEIDYDDVAGSGHTKKELLGLRREKDKLDKTLGGIRAMPKVPSVLWVIDTNKEHLALEEANTLGIPVVGILDSNCDPDKIAYGIPGNDDAIRAVHLLTRVIADAVAEGLVARHAAHPEAGAEPVEAEPLAEWERELLGGDADATVVDAVTSEAPAEPVADAERVADADVKKHAGKKPEVAKPAGAKPAAAKPTAAKPEAAKPTAAKPADVKKPAAAKKPAASKPAASKPAATDEK